MSRVINEGSPAGPAPRSKGRMVACPHCSVSLNLPESALGRKLKCPHCEARFMAPPAPQATRAADTSSGFLPAVEPDSTLDLPYYPTNFDGEGGSSGSYLAASPPPLRESFDLPMLDGLAAEPAAPRRPRADNDAMALFQDEPKANRRPRGAEARQQARRCTSCSSIVPAGMSLCSRCGLDLDTGQRVAPMEIYDDEMPVAPVATMPPIGVILLGSLAVTGFAVLGLLSLVQWAQGTQGAQFLLIVWAFGLFGATQFLRRKSIRPLFIALSLAVGVGTIYLIALPIYEANTHETNVQTLDGPDGNLTTTADDPNFDRPAFRPITDKLNLNRITWGVGSLLTYAALSVYLNSPSLRRQFKK